MALIHGVKSNFSCPICLIPHISDFPAQCKLQTSKNIVKVLEDACSQDTQEKKEQILIQQGLHDVDSAFMAVVNTDVYCTLSWDWLHANFSGKFGDHLWTELLRILDKARHQTMAMVEKNFSEMPHRHTLNHFDEALSISYTDGQKFEDLSKSGATSAKSGSTGPMEDLAAEIDATMATMDAAALASEDDADNTIDETGPAAASCSGTTQTAPAVIEECTSFDSEITVPMLSLEVATVVNPTSIITKKTSTVLKSTRGRKSKHC
ncbi:hypothetical protein PISMIDRAFT_12104 [Pisolithus microcarpus 441]|uniref:Uncharacterized protein n=1 Tax=Pisolithus microcarpus 441 TaxID=765257 RepID=A0A0C9Z6I3_9AGAM|nr:hypothetical protein PISMIDRAFT_12104 [Pisolithus microcarpus 441]